MGSKAPGSKKLIPFTRNDGSKPIDDPANGTLVENGTIGEDASLHWEVFSYGTIHIDDGPLLTFKKDCDLFEQELEKVPDDLADGDEHVIPGSGDNDDLVIACKEGKYVLSVRKRGLGIISKLREVISKARSHKSVNTKKNKTGRGQ